MYEVKEKMEDLITFCKKNKVDTDLEARFEKGHENMSYLWRI